ncbi:unnamed protein product [Rotaria magnacalcarata]|uniref:Cytochrome P450 n=1 Tax=Rotaria magnacalcarata TaxID=392030 RepID=A0A816M8M6_9BILA|nr:unnamed protein product [Rotaria magnacalcarata]
MMLYLFLFFAGLLFAYIKFKHFTLRGPIPGLSPHLFFGNIIQTGLLSGRRVASEVYILLNGQFGDIYQYWLGFIHFVVVHNIDDVQYILSHRNIYDQGQIFLEKFSILVPNSIICNIGAKFKRHGAFAMPLFRRSKIISNINIVIDGLSRKELFDEMLMFLIAGYETTSTALAWSIYQLSKNPRVQQKLKTELMQDSSSQYLTVHRVDSLIYLDCFINEVLRYSPTIDGTSRSVVVDDCLPKSGIRLYKGDQVLIPTSALSRDTRLWNIDPEQFYPERFLNEDKNHHPCALLPFGGGHRQCLGQDLARFELKVILARMLQQVTFVDGGPEVNAGGFSQTLTIIPKHVGVTIEFH